MLYVCLRCPIFAVHDACGGSSLVVGHLKMLATAADRNAACAGLSASSALDQAERGGAIGRALASCESMTMPKRVLQFGVRTRTSEGFVGSGVYRCTGFAYTVS